MAEDARARRSRRAARSCIRRPDHGGRDRTEYVGVTGRAVPARYWAHCHDAMPCRKRRRTGSPVEAIIRTLRAGIGDVDAFMIRTLETTEDAASVRRLEAEWIVRRGSAAPAGFNLMPGGSSLEGPASVMPVIVQDSARGTVSYPSLSSAIRATDKDRRNAGDGPLVLRRSTGGCRQAGGLRRRLAWCPGRAGGHLPGLSVGGSGIPNSERGLRADRGPGGDA